MYLNSIVKIERCDGAIEDEQGGDPFMDISSLTSNVKMEVTELSHSSVDLKPELPILPVQKDEEIHPGEFLQVKKEEINSQVTFEPSSEEETEDSSEDDEEGDEAPTGKYEGVLFKDVMEEFIKKHKPNRSLLILLKSEPSLRFLPQLGSVRCEPCYLGSNSSGISSKKGYKFQKPTNKAASLINRHVSTKEHLQYTANTNICNQTDPKESADLDEPGQFINDSILELFKSKFSASPSLLRILESDMKGTQSLVYFQKHKSLRCEVCYRNKVTRRSKEYDLSKEILQGKRGICIDADLEQIIVRHFNSDAHSFVIKRRYYFGQIPHKRPKISQSEGTNPGNFSSPSNSSKSSLDGSKKINEETIKIIKSHLKSPLSQTIIKILNSDYKGDGCLVYLPALKSIRCEICFRDDGIRIINKRYKGDMVREGGMKDFNDCRRAANISQHLSSQRHIQILLKEKRNGRDQNSSLPIESPSLINPVKVKIEPDFGSNPMNFEEGSGQLNGADSIELPGIVIESVDIKEEKTGI